MINKILQIRQVKKTQMMINKIITKNKNKTLIYYINFNKTTNQSIKLKAMNNFIKLVKVRLKNNNFIKLVKMILNN